MSDTTVENVSSSQTSATNKYGQEMINQLNLFEGNNPVSLFEVPVAPVGVLEQNTMENAKRQVEAGNSICVEAAHIKEKEASGKFPGKQETCEQEAHNGFAALATAAFEQDEKQQEAAAPVTDAPVTVPLKQEATVDQVQSQIPQVPQYGAPYLIPVLPTQTMVSQNGAQPVHSVLVPIDLTGQTQLPMNFPGLGVMHGSSLVGPHGMMGASPFSLGMSVQGHADTRTNRKRKRKNRLCAISGCTKNARGRTAYCVRHGGGTRCSVEGCEKGARPHSKFCSAHGGGHRCLFAGCNKGALAKSVYCRRHGKMSQNSTLGQMV